MTQARARGPVTHVEAGDMMQAERRERLLPPRNDNHRPSIHSKTAALFESSTPAAARLPGPSPSTKGHLRTLRDRGGRPLSRASRQRAAEAHTAAATRQRWAKQGPTPWLFSSTKRPIHGKKGRRSDDALFFSCWVGFLMTTNVVSLQHFELSLLIYLRPPFTTYL